jgi:hypothetical protein
MMLIDLSLVAPRNYQAEIERALTRAGFVAVAEALHSARPRDLIEIWPLLPEEVSIKLQEVPHAAE